MHRETVLCSGCGGRIVWAHIGGVKVPLDAVAPVYHRLKDPETGKHYWLLDDKHDRTALVSHFSTCTERNMFSGRNRSRKATS